MLTVWENSPTINKISLCLLKFNCKWHSKKVELTHIPERARPDGKLRKLIDVSREKRNFPKMIPDVCNGKGKMNSSRHVFILKYISLLYAYCMQPPSNFEQIMILFFSCFHVLVISVRFAGSTSAGTLGMTRFLTKLKPKRLTLQSCRILFALKNWKFRFSLNKL